MYENVKLKYPNFCLSPNDGEFGTVDHVESKFRFYDDTGNLERTYSLDSSVTAIRALEYVGSRSLNTAYDNLGESLPFFTLENISSSNCLIKKWHLDNVGVTEFKLQQTISLTSSGSYYFNCYAMAVENYDTQFTDATTTGTGRIKIDSTYRLSPGDTLLLGPSTDMDNPYAFEEVNVVSISGGWVYISTNVSGVEAPLYEYVSSNKVSYYKDIYLFSDTGQNGNSSVGSLYRIDSISGTVLDVWDSGIYNGIRAASWSRDYSMPGFVQDATLLYFNMDTGYIYKSQILTNIAATGGKWGSTILPVYSILFDDANIYRLQTATTLCDDAGIKTTYDWSGSATPYNYQFDTIGSYARSVDIQPYPDSIILNNETRTLTATVRNQFGAALSSKHVKFYDSPDCGDFTPLDGEADTDLNGRASVTYETYYYDPLLPDDDDRLPITISLRSEGSSTLVLGSVYVWEDYILDFHKRYRYINESTDAGIVKQISDQLSSYGYVTQVSGIQSGKWIKCLSKFQFPGGNWNQIGAPQSDVTSVRQLEAKTDFVSTKQISNDFDNDSWINQKASESDTFQLSQLYVSRHVSSGHKDTATVQQFIFTSDAQPPMWSEKNPVDTDISIKLYPYGFSLNQSTLVFKVREVSYAGDTGYVDVTFSCSISTFDAGGGMLGLYIIYNPATNFHHNAVVYVSIEVQDIAPSPNIILTDYWFKIIPDYRAPYIENELPGREEEDALVTTNIEFDVVDAGVGVDISTLKIYVNNRYVTPTVSGISGGYHVVYDPLSDFFYGESVSVLVYVSDILGNLLHDAWRFYCTGSPGPWIDRGSFFPKNCSRGVYRKITGLSANVYGIDGGGVDPDSILVSIGGKSRDVVIIPIIYRID